MKQFTVTALVNYTQVDLYGLQTSTVDALNIWRVEDAALIPRAVFGGEREFAPHLWGTFNFAALIYVLKVQIIKQLVHDKASEGQFLLVHCCMQHADEKPTTPFASVWIKPTTCSQHQKNVVGVLRHRCFKTLRSHRECMVNHASCLQFFQ